MTPQKLYERHSHLEPRQFRGTADSLRNYGDRPGVWSMEGVQRRNELYTLADLWDAAADIAEAAQGGRREATRDDARF